MHKSIASLFLCAVCVQATAAGNSMIVRNGIRYTEYWQTPRCLDGSAKLSYQKKTWCPIYGVTLSWSAPVTRTNGKPLMASDIAAYEIYWVREVDDRSGTMSKSRTSQSAEFNVLTPDVYHFAISAVDTDGLKSPLSPVISVKLAKK